MINMKNIFVLLFAICLMMYSYGQNSINQKDAEGRKNGLWIKDYPDSHWELRYKNGILHGVFVGYGKNQNKICTIGEYANGEPVGTWYYFTDDGTPSYKVYDFMKNDTIIIGDNKNLMEYKPFYKAWNVYYYPSGNKKSEGLLLFSEDPELESFKYGIWSYYDEDGTMVEKRMHKP